MLYAVCCCDLEAWRWRLRLRLRWRFEILRLHPSLRNRDEIYVILILIPVLRNRGGDEIYIEITMLRLILMQVMRVWSWSSRSVIGCMTVLLSVLTGVYFDLC